MNLPVEPTTMPQVRKYSRTFNADRTKIYREGDQIKIQIPPIANTYLTKNSKIYFDFDLSYNMYTEQNVIDVTNHFNSEAADVAFLFGKVFNTKLASVEATNYSQLGTFLTKPFPTFDINGAYGLFDRIQVHDYLGTTLLEDIENHDLLTAILTDFDFQNEDFEVYRPVLTNSDVSEFNSFVKKPNCALPFNGADEFRSFMWEPMQVRILANTLNYPGDILLVDNIDTKVNIPTYKACINLYSFLGKLSNKFVPLHNGFTITLHVNQINIPISFCNSIPTQSIGGIRHIVFPDGVYIHKIEPSIISHSISNVYYKCDLLELSHELDSKVDKLLHTVSYKYNLNNISYKETYTNRLLPSVKSLRKTYISQRSSNARYFNNTSRKLSYRINNGLYKSSFLFNKSTVCENNGSLEHYESIKNAFGKTMNNYYDMSDMKDNWSVDDSSQQSLPLLNKNLIDNIRNQYYLFYHTLYPDDITSEEQVIFYKALENIPETSNRPGNGGKFLVVFDTMIPGSMPEAIAGMDTSSNVVEYKLNYNKDDFRFFIIAVDVFMEYDAVIHVDPGKSTSVSF